MPPAVLHVGDGRDDRERVRRARRLVSGERHVVVVRQREDESGREHPAGRPAGIRLAECLCRCRQNGQPQCEENRETGGVRYTRRVHLVPRSLGDDDRVARPEVDGPAGPLHGVLVIEVERVDARRRPAQDPDVLRVRKVLEPPRHGECLQDRHRSGQRQGTGLVDLAHHVDVRGDGLLHDDGHDRVGHVVLEHRRQPVAQFERREAHGGDVADERHGDLPVGPDLERLRELRVLVNLDAQLVARAQPVVADVDVCGVVRRGGPVGRRGGRRRSARAGRLLRGRPRGGLQRNGREDGQERGQPPGRRAAGARDVVHVRSIERAGSTVRRALNIGRETASRISVAASAASVGQQDAPTATDSGAENRWLSTRATTRAMTACDPSPSVSGRTSQTVARAAHASRSVPRTSWQRISASSATVPSSAEIVRPSHTRRASIATSATKVWLRMARLSSAASAGSKAAGVRRRDPSR